VPAVEEAGEHLSEDERNSHEADITAGFEDDDAELAGEDAPEGGPDGSYEADVRAGYDDASDSPVGDDRVAGR
jgi:hypothetical protein